MKKSIRILSLLMAFAMLIGSFSVLGNAYAPYKDSAVSYNDVDAPEFTTEQYASMALDELDRMLLKEKIEIYLPKWENITGLHCDSWQTKYMTTRWGTCNTNSRKIWFNLQLAKKPIECLEYVILHELAHLKIKGHNKEFVALLDKYMPYWRDTRKLLNELKLDYMEDNNDG